MQNTMLVGEINLQGNKGKEKEIELHKKGVKYFEIVYFWVITYKFKKISDQGWFLPQLCTLGKEHQGVVDRNAHYISLYEKMF